MQITKSLFTTLALVSTLSIAIAADPAPKKESTLEKVGKSIEKEAVAVTDTVDSQVDKTLGKPLPFQTTITTIDVAKKQFTSTGKNGKINTFHITDHTVITKDEAPATLADLKVGETVHGTRYKTGPGEWEALHVMIGAKAPAAPKPAKEKDPKAAEVKPAS